MSGGRLLLPLAADVAWACALATIGIAIWALGRGFDISDEGFYLLSYSDRQPAFPSTNRAGLMVQQTLGWLVHGVVGWRVVHLVVVLASSALLAYGLIRYLRSAHGGVPPARLVVPLIVIGAMAGYVFGPPTASYNHFVGAALTAAAGLVFVTSARTAPDRRVRSLAPLVGAGFLLGLTFFMKPPSAIAGLVLVAGVLLIAPPPNGRIRAVIALGLGAALAVGAYFLIVESPAHWHAGIVEALKDKTHSSAFLRMIYARSIRSLWPPLQDSLPLLAGTVLALRLRDRMRTPVLFLLLALFAAIEIRYLYTHPRLRVGSTLARGGLVVVAFAVAMAIGAPGRGSGRRWAALLAMCLALPVAGAFGTDNPLHYNMVFTLGGWAAAVALLVAVMDPAVARSAGTVLIAATVVLGAAEFYDSYVQKPYRLGGPLTRQTIRLDEGPLRGLLVDAATADMVQSIDEVRLHNPTTGMPVVALRSTPGVAFLLGGYEPGAGYSFPGNDVFNCLEVRRARLGKVLIAAPLTSGTVEVPPCLTKVGLDVTHPRFLGRFTWAWDAQDFVVALARRR